MTVYADRVQETFTTTGTGTISLGGAVTGYQAFSAALTNGQTCYYAATDGTNWEVGLGTFASAGDTLARTTVLASSNAGSAVNWSAGTKNIWLDFPAAAAAASIKSVVIQRIFSSGTYTPTANMVTTFAQVGGGGGGGGGGGSGGSGAGGSGGGAGESFEGFLTAAQIGASQTVTLGAAGTGGATTANGVNGGTTTVGALVSCAGGIKGLAGSTGAGSISGGLGGTSGLSTNGYIAGQPGGTGVNMSGGGTGNGGNSPFGVGGQAHTAANGNGSAAIGNGAGGGAGSGSGSGNSGSTGYAIFIDFCS